MATAQQSPPSSYHANWGIGAPPPRPSPLPGGTGAPPPHSNYADAINAFSKEFADSPYLSTPAFQTLFTNLTSDAGRTLVNPGNATGFATQIKGMANTFGSIFKNYTGQDPTADEYNKFFEQVINPKEPWGNRASLPDQATLTQNIQSFINTNMSQDVNKAVEKTAQDQADAATATGSPFDKWQKAYTSSINDVETSLKDYQSRLFEKLRPNLITSLKAQGLLDTGALNTAFAGAASDLTSAGQNYLSTVRANAAQDIAGKKFAITSAPGTTRLSNTLAIPGNLSQSGQNALDMAYGANIQQQLLNQQLNGQKSLYQMQLDNQPSLLSQYGGMILGGVTAGATRSMFK